MSFSSCDDLEGMRASCRAVCTRHPLATASPHIAYGTAGFRAQHNEQLVGVLVRAALVSVVRCKAYHGTSRVVGLMITASHNPPCDNGLKIVERDGAMLVEDWEERAQRICNIDNGDEVWTQLVRAFAMLSSIDHDGVFSERDAERAMRRLEWMLVIGRDTRRGGDGIAAAIVRAVREVFGQEGRIEEMGEVTTPMLHYRVRQLWMQKEKKKTSCSDDGNQIEDDACEEEYVSRLASGYEALVMSDARRSGTSISGDDSTSVMASRKQTHTIQVDCAYGVGTAAVRRLDTSLDVLTISAVNASTCDDACTKLNVRCGADYVQKSLHAPERVSDSGIWSGLCCSLDGDADRVIFFDGDADMGSFRCFDGDRIAILIASLVRDTVAEAFGTGSGAHGVDVGIVQTAYANGASTAYARDALGLRVARSKTGVKHLHRIATTHFDIGVYFEANGHGSLTFSERASRAIRTRARSMDVPGAHHARRLEAVMRVLNPAVGDALSGLLLVDAALHLRRWTADDWWRMYTDLPSVQTKAIVNDRSKICTDDTEERVLQPPDLQALIDTCARAVLLRSSHDDGDVMSRTTKTTSTTASVERDDCVKDASHNIDHIEKSTRWFIRPSGTEDIVRIYVESPTLGIAQSIASALTDLLESLTL